MLKFYTIQLWLTQIANIIANSRVKFVKNILIYLFIKKHKVDMTEAEEGSDPFVYTSYNNFFTRKLKPSLRPIDNTEKCLISPADCRIHSYGKIDTLIAKNDVFNVETLCGKNDYSKNFISGQQITCYLAPNFYHRVHMPYGGKLLHVTHIPGTLFSVNSKKKNFSNDIFGKNERVVMFFQITHGNMAVIFVGAMIVGHIAINHVPLLIPHTLTVNHYKFEDKNIVITKGEELGMFKLGSTVIILLDHPIQWNNFSDKINMGSKLGGFY